MFYCKCCSKEVVVFHSLCDICDSISKIVHKYTANIVLNTLKKNDKKIKEYYDNMLVIKDIKENIKGN